MAGICTCESDVGFGRVWASRGLGSTGVKVEVESAALPGGSAELANGGCGCLEGAVLDRERVRVCISMVGIDSDQQSRLRYEVARQTEPLADFDDGICRLHPAFVSVLSFHIHDASSTTLAVLSKGAICRSWQWLSIGPVIFQLQVSFQNADRTLQCTGESDLLDMIGV